MRLLIVVLVSALLTVGHNVQCEAAGQGAELLREMKRTGKPALVIAGNEGCVHCRVLAQELATVKEIQPLVRQFLVLKVDTDSAVWPAVRNALKFEGSGIPAVFVVRADGQVLYSKSGKPSDVGSFLENMLEKSGTILDSDRLDAVRKSVRDAQRAMKRGDIESVISLVKAHDVGDSYADAAITLQALKEELLESATSEATAAEELISQDDKPIESALALAELRRTFSDFEEAAESIETVWARLSENEDHAALLEQAEQLNQAAQHIENREWEAAIAVYRRLIESAPESDAAAIAQGKLPDVEKRMTPTTTSGDESKPASGNSEGDPAKAASYLKFAKVYLERDVAKARKYLQRAIDAAPESDAAAEAKGLLDDLD